MMHSLESMLRDYEPVMLGVIADRWDVDLESYSVTDITGVLVSAMLNPEAAAATWERLDDAQRGAMQSLLGAKGVMPARMFFRLYGEIREMGPGRLEREKPYLDPISITEALYYRGLIGQGYDETTTGTGAVIYVPFDLAQVLPAHHTGFDLSVEEDESLFEDEDEEGGWTIPAEQPDEVFPTDTSLVDDITTLLAYLQVAAVATKEDDILPQAHVDMLVTFLLKQDLTRLNFMLGLAHSLALIGTRDGLLKPVSQNARRWLEAPRAEQVKALALGWLESLAYNDLCHTPGLVVETVGNDPRLGRQMIVKTLSDLPLDSWWIVDNVVEAIRQENPDFQRPGGDYDSWYIRHEADETYLNGFESWDAVDGAMLRFMMVGPLHWLGLADLGRYSGQWLGRLNAYGRAFVGQQTWPSQPEPEVTIALQASGVVEASRRLSRYDRFQLARFTEWLEVGDKYRYRFSPAGLRRAAIQGIEVTHIRAYLRRVLGSMALPESIDAMLTRWGQTADADATIEQLTVLRMGSEQALDSVIESPGVRRYLGARLGPDAVIVRPGQAAALQNALAEHGLLADMPDQGGD